MTDLKKTITAIEKSATIEEAANRLGIKRRALYGRLERANLVVVRDVTLRVIELIKETRI